VVTQLSITDRPRGNRVAGKVAVVSGAGSGIGRTCAELLAREGANVVVGDIKVDGGEQTVVAIREAGGEAEFVATDLRNEADCQRLIARAVEHYGRIDVLANVAGIYPRASLENTTVEFWEEIMAVNLRGPFLLCREAVPIMVQGGGGSIINFGSANGLAGGASLFAYSVSKGGMLTLTRNIAAAYAHEGIRANYLIPGWVLTDNERVVQAREGHDAAWLDEVGQRQLTGRFSTPEDAAFGVLYLASDDSIHVSGTMLNTDGGSSMLPNLRRFMSPNSRSR